MSFLAGKSIARGRRRFRLAATAVAACLPLLAGCMSSGIDEALSVDLMTTGAIAPAAALPETDEMAVARAVADADLDRLPEGPFAWANSATGSNGVISSLVETYDDAGACREFRTSLHRYDGISLFAGTSCRDGSGAWNLTAFESVR